MDCQEILKCLSIKGSEVVLYKGKQTWKKRTERQPPDFAKHPGYIIVAVDWPEKQTVTLKGQRMYPTAALDLAQQISLCAGTAAVLSLLASKERSLPTP